MNKVKNILLDAFIKVITFDYYAIKKSIHKWLPKGNIRVLDLGCGTGTLSSLYPKSGYLGFDLDLESIEIAKEKNPGYSFLIGDITSLKMAASFDFATIIGVLHHLTNKQMALGLQVLKKYLKPKARAIIIEAIPPIDSWNVVGRILRNLDQGDYIRSLKEYEKTISKQFNIIHQSLQRGGLVDYAVFIVTKRIN